MDKIFEPLTALNDERSLGRRASYKEHNAIQTNLMVTAATAIIGRLA
jgi:hypothetical protein